MTENTGHVHAQNMKLYAEDAAKTATPWRLWEYGIFEENRKITWMSMTVHPLWDVDMIYRRKPQYLFINNYKFPEPLKTIPLDAKIDDCFWLVKLDNSQLVVEIDLPRCDNLILAQLLQKGLLHSTKAAAILHAKALLSFTSETN